MERGVSGLPQTERDEAEATEEGEPPESERGSGVPLRSELAEQNEALGREIAAQAQEIAALRAELAECKRELEALKKDEPEPEPSAETQPEPKPEDPEGYEPGSLRDAVMAGELSALSELMDKGVDPNSPRETEVVADSELTLLALDAESFGELLAIEPF